MNKQRLADDLRSIARLYVDDNHRYTRDVLERAARLLEKEDTNA